MHSQITIKLNYTFNCYWSIIAKQKITSISQKSPTHIDAYVVCEHESSGLNDKLVRFLVFDNSSCQTGRSARLATGVHSSRTELLHLPLTPTPAIIDLSVTRHTLHVDLSLQKHNIH